MKAVYLIAAVLLLTGCFSLPAGYYAFLRIATFIASGIVVCLSLEKGLNWSNICFGAVAILYNPFIPIYLHDKTTWIILDIITAILFIIYAIITPEKTE